MLTKAKRTRPLKPKYHGKKMSLEEFLEFRPEDGFKYEWESGFLEAREKMIKPSELYIVENLRAAFEQTTFKQRRGAMVTEAVYPVSEGRYRVPDISFFTKAQIDEGREGKLPVASFIIELVSVSSPKDVRICAGDDSCSAAPALPDFQLSVNQIFSQS